MANNNIIFEIKDDIAFITFNRPKQLNALNNALFDEFVDALEQISVSKNVRVLILTGAGEKAFVAGADIGEIAECNTLSAKVFAEKGQHVIGKLQQLSIPVIAAVNGYALGGGTEIVLACDFAYASETAFLGLPEITLGLIPGFGGTQRLSKLIGIARAKEMIFTGQMIPASIAYDYGIINKVCPPELLMEEVIKTARKIASKGRLSLGTAKEVINRGINADLEIGMTMEANAFALCIASEDSREGISAFLEKRQPVFKSSI